MASNFFTHHWFKIKDRLSGSIFPPYKHFSAKMHFSSKFYEKIGTYHNMVTLPPSYLKKLHSLYIGTFSLINFNWGFLFSLIEKTPQNNLSWHNFSAKNNYPTYTFSRRIFSSNQIVQKILLSLWFWASDLLFDQF